MPRFSAPFSRRKSNADELQNVDLTTPERPVSSFRVLERNDFPGKSFDGGARMARASTIPVPKPGPPQHHQEDNMFANLKVNNRDSGASHTTKATSTDNSSRHSNASTAPSSADMGAGNAHDEGRAGKKNSKDASDRAAQKSGTASFLNRAGRTFSFGVQKKNTIPPPPGDTSADVPAVPALYEDEYNRSRGMTTSTTSTATPPKLEGGSGMDMGGDFGSMFTGFDKRASTSTLKNMGSPTPRALIGTRVPHPAPLNLDTSQPVDPSPQSWNSQHSNDDLLGSKAHSPLDYDRPPPVPRHQSPLDVQASRRAADVAEDEDTKLLQDSLLAGQYLSSPNDSGKPSALRRKTEEETFTVLPRKPIASSFAKADDNLFDSSMSRFRNTANRQAPIQTATPSQNKVMTTAEFERYRQDRERQERLDKANNIASKDDDEEVNYEEEEEEDEAERQKELVKQRRKQQAHMAVYRQQMMKVTGESAMPSPPPSVRPGLQTSMSAPQIIPRKSPSPDPSALAADEEDDEDVPLAILQAHGFPNKNRPPTRLSTVGSQPNLRASVAGMPAAAPSARPGSSLGESSNSGHQRHSTLPAFARGLPQDPFVGASIAKPALRESLSFSGGSQANHQSGGMPPGGLVGVIANEERSRAMRRGSPNMDGQKMMNGMPGQQGPGFDPLATIPHHMMYNGGRNSMMPGMMGMPQQPVMSAGEQAQIQMTQQMQQFMQMQMQFMQMMSGNQGGAPPMQPPYGGGIQGSQSMADLSSRQSMLGDPMGQPRQFDPSMRTMSMVQPQFLAQHNMAPSIQIAGPGYSPSIAPSERSNVGLPGRYRPVSQAGVQPPGLHQRASTMSGALGQWDDPRNKSTVRIVTHAAEGSDDDDEEGWEAMKAARDQKMAERKSKKIDFIPSF